MNTIVMIARQLRERWEAEGVNPLPGATEEELSLFERRYGIVLGADLRAFFGVANGMPSGAMDPFTMMRFWPLQEVVPVKQAGVMKDASRYDGYFLFADYSIWVHGYAINLSPNTPPNPPVAEVAGDEPEIVAADFESFLRKQLEV
jgi:hypothetical protein